MLLFAAPTRPRAAARARESDRVTWRIRAVGPPMTPALGGGAAVRSRTRSPDRSPTQQNWPRPRPG